MLVEWGLPKFKGARRKLFWHIYPAFSAACRFDPFICCNNDLARSLFVSFDDQANCYFDSRDLRYIGLFWRHSRKSENDSYCVNCREAYKNINYKYFDTPKFEAADRAEIQLRLVLALS